MTNAGAPTRKDGVHGGAASCPFPPAPIPEPHDALTLHAMLEGLKSRAVRDRHFAAWFEAGEWIAYIRREAASYPAKWRGYLQRTKGTK